MKPNSVSLVLFVLGIATLLTGCVKGDDMGGERAFPALPQSDIALAAADVQVDGRSVASATISPGSGTSTLFTVTLADATDRARVARMQMDYAQHSAMGMMGTRSSLDCYDDGTHGDAVAGDGMYSYRDEDGHVGPHYEGCVAGEYGYTFHGMDLDGNHTNSLEVRVTVR
jgi:hypothetical protein